MASIIDSYSESNLNSGLALFSGYRIYQGQSFYCGEDIELDSCTLFLGRDGSPTGSLVYQIYAHTGTYGNFGEPTGTALATSESLDVSTLTLLDYGAERLDFTGDDRITLSADTPYFLIAYFDGGDASNYVAMGKDGPSPTHGGNVAYSNDASNWDAFNTADLCFYAYGGGSHYPMPSFNPSY